MNRYFKYQFVASRIQEIPIIQSISVPRLSKFIIVVLKFSSYGFGAQYFINILLVLQLLNNLSPKVAMIIRLLSQ